MTSADTIFHRDGVRPRNALLVSTAFLFAFDDSAFMKVFWPLDVLNLVCTINFLMNSDRKYFEKIETQKKLGLYNLLLSGAEPREYYDIIVSDMIKGSHLL